MHRTFFLSIVIAASCSFLTHAELNWPAFRGPTGQGISAETGLPLTWSESDNIAWKTDIPGKGWSSPVVWGDRIWLTTAVEEVLSEEEKAAKLEGDKQASQRQVLKSVQLRAVCIDSKTGAVKHDLELLRISDPDPIHLLNSYASPTPVIEDGRLYCHFGTFGTICLDTQTGAKIWERQLPLQHAVGPGSSPIIWNDLLVLVCDGMESQYVTALSKQTGESVWKTDRPPMEGDNGDFHKAFSSPLVVNWQGQDQILVPGAQWFVSYEPSSGAMLWHVNHGKGFSNVAAPVFAKGISYLITGFTKPELWAVPVSGKGQLTAENVMWEQKRQVPKKSSPVLAGTDLYMISDNGVLSCVDLDTGEIRWSARLDGNYSASPLLADGRLYFLSHEGKATVVEPNREKLIKLAENELDGQLMASPVATNGGLLIRSDTALYRID